MPPPSAAQIEALLAHVEPLYRTPCALMLRGEAFTFAQGWQDWYLFWNYFSERLTWGGGTYIDIGTSRPTQLSNTLFFDKCLGWRGVCFEMDARWHPSIRANRSCTLVPHCVVGAGEAGTVVRKHGMAAQRAGANEVAADPALRCVSAAEELPAILGPAPTIDFLSIDVEAMEPDVLRCFPFRELNVFAVLSETNKAGEDFRHVDRFFHRHGYANVETFSWRPMGMGGGEFVDHLFVRKERDTVYPPWTDENGGRCHPERWRWGSRASRDEVTGAHVRVSPYFHPHRECQPWSSWRPPARKWRRCELNGSHHAW